MKKQGPPEPLSDAAISAIKKRKAEQINGTSAVKRRRTSDEEDGDEPAKATLKRPSFANRDLGDGILSLTGAKPISPAPERPAKSRINGDKSTSKRQSSQATQATVRGQKGTKTKPASHVESEEPASGSHDGFDEEQDDSPPSLIDDEPLISGDGDSILDSDFEDSGEGLRATGMFSDDEDEEALTAANIEGLSNKLDAEALEEAEEAEAELRTNIKDPSDPSSITALPLGLAPDLQLLRTRIDDTIRLLSTFSTLPTPRPPREEFTSQLQTDLATYYGYSPFLCNMLSSLFKVAELVPFFDANEKPRPIVIRTNTLKTTRRLLAQSLISRGVVLQPVGKWSKTGLQIFESPVPLGATPEYLAGHYMLQSASSFLPVHALAPQPGERILDMAAAPGGKTTHMSALMQNSGAIFANDASKPRTKALIGNIHRLGCTNVIVSNMDSRAFPKTLGGFDRVLLDAPCSGTGVIGKDPSVKTNRTERDFMLLPHRQKELLLHAIDSVDHASKTGGYLVYSTCSIAVEENEQVVQYALAKRPNVRLADTGLDFGVDGFVSYRSKRFDKSMRLTKRFYPHKYNVDGFFVAKFRKTGPLPKGLRAAGSEGSGIELPTEGLTIGDSDQKLEAAKTSKRAGKGLGVAEDGDEGDEEDKHSEGGFSAFDDEADQQYIERSLRNLLKRRGRNPDADAKGAAAATTEVNGKK